MKGSAHPLHPSHSFLSIHPTPQKMEAIHLFSPTLTSTQPSPHSPAPSSSSPAYTTPPHPNPLYCHANPVTTLLISLSSYGQFQHQNMNCNTSVCVPAACTGSNARARSFLAQFMSVCLFVCLHACWLPFSKQKKKSKFSQRIKESYFFFGRATFGCWVDS